LQHAIPASVAETAVYSESDGVVDWRYCKTDGPEADFSVSGTHVGMVVNPSVYDIVAERLAKAGYEGARDEWRATFLRTTTSKDVIFKEWL
jgi:hypothetical protein